jgi:hypothetical protein
LVTWLDEVDVVNPLFRDSIKVRYDVAMRDHKIVHVKHERFKGLVMLLDHLATEQVLVLQVNLLSELGHIVKGDSLLLFQGYHQSISREFWCGKITNKAFYCLLNQEVVEVNAQLGELLGLADFLLASINNIGRLAFFVFVTAVDELAIPVEVKLTRLSDSCSELFRRFLQLVSAFENYMF